MGYYTQVQMSASCPNWDKSIGDAINNDLYELSDGGQFYLEYDEEYHYWDLGEVKWYDDDIVPVLYAISLRHPSVLFEVNGNGENGYDLWTEYWMNGSCQLCSVENGNYEVGFLEDRLCPYDPATRTFYTCRRDNFFEELKRCLLDKSLISRLRDVILSYAEQQKVMDGEMVEKAFRCRDVDAFIAALTGHDIYHILSEATGNDV